MKFSEARQGRIFILRLEHGEFIHEEIERFAREHAINAAAIIILGGADSRSKLVVGPKNGQARPVKPMTHVLWNSHEATGTGTLFPDIDGNPMVHIHISCGRNDSTITGCIRSGVRVWQIMEVVLFELTDTSAKRIRDPELGFALLNP